MLRGLYWLALLSCCAPMVQAQSLTPTNQLMRDIYKELVEINTGQEVGDTYAAAQAMAARLRAAGYTDSELQTFETAPKRGNLVARLKGTGKKKPIMLLAHLDVVEAKREDWTMEPYQFIEKDGYFYGRGTGDDKYMAAAATVLMIRYKQEKYRPDRDIILALTADEEIGDRYEYGIRWLLKNKRESIDAEFALNEGGPVAVIDGKPAWVSIQTTEKMYQSFWLEVRDKGGHSSLPTENNAIFHLAAGLERLGKYKFPVQLNDTTRQYFTRMAQMEKGQVAADMKAVTAAQPDPEAVARLSKQVPYNAQLRTTCVATRLEGGHADNALPQLARAMINCRIVPGVKAEQVHKTLIEVLADESIKVTAPEWDTPSDPSPLDANILKPIEQTAAKFWPGVPILPIMSSGASDGRFLRNAGIPTYGHTGLAADIFDVRAHGRDERVNVKAAYEGQEYLYQLVKRLAAGR